MININNYILEKFKINKDIKNDDTPILIFDSKNKEIIGKFYSLQKANRVAKEYDKTYNYTGQKFIKSAKINTRFIVINYDNLTPEAKECINTWPEILDLDLII